MLKGDLPACPHRLFRALRVGNFLFAVQKLKCTFRGGERRLERVDHVRRLCERLGGKVDILEECLYDAERHFTREHPAACKQQNDCLRKAGQEADHGIDAVGQEVGVTRRFPEFLCIGGDSIVSLIITNAVAEVSRVAAVDKSSTILSVLFAILLFQDERTLWWLKLIFLALIAVGTYLMTDIRRNDRDGRLTWLIFAVLSAVFAAATSLLARIGIENVDSNLATAVRTTVVLILAWLIVFCRKEQKFIR